MSLAASAPTNRQPLRRLVILDFEATCDNEGPAPVPQEIIEFPAILLDVDSGEVESIFHHYIRPTVHPDLNEFCTELTGITQEMVDGGTPIQEALAMHQDWLIENGLLGGDEGSNNFVYVTCGDWDLRRCLPNELKYKSVRVPAFFERWINIKVAFENQYKLGRRPKGMVAMLEELDLELIGRHHSGIDDCKNIVRICQKMLTDGWEPRQRRRANK